MQNLKNRVEYKGKGLTSKKDVSVKIFDAEPGSGISFLLSEFGNYCPDGKSDYAASSSGSSCDESWPRKNISAIAENICSTVRNTALGIDRYRLCYIEHLMCAIALCGIDDLLIQVDGAELPMGNGSADFWVKMLCDAGLQKSISDSDLIELSHPVYVSSGDKMIMALPDEKFSATYLLDMNHPMVGKSWGSWSVADGISAIADARTFGPLQEHKMLGFENDVVSFTADGFSEELRFRDEPVRHKILDLIGDMFLCGVNPLRIKARFVSIKGGHSLDVEMAKKLALAVRNK